MRLLHILLFLPAISSVLQAQGGDTAKIVCECVETKVKFDKIGELEQYHRISNTLEQLRDTSKITAVRKLLSQAPVELPDKGKFSGTLSAIVRDSLCLALIKGEGYTEANFDSLQNFQIVSNLINTPADFNAYKYLLACKAIKILAARHRAGVNNMTQPNDDSQERVETKVTEFHVSYLFSFLLYLGSFIIVSLYCIVGYIVYQTYHINKELRKGLDLRKPRVSIPINRTNELRSETPDEEQDTPKTDSGHRGNVDETSPDTPPMDTPEQDSFWGEESTDAANLPINIGKEGYRNLSKKQQRIEEERRRKLVRQVQIQQQTTPIYTKLLYAELPNGNIISRISASLQQEITFLVIKLDRDERSGELNLVEDTLTLQRALFTVEILSDACNLVGTPGRRPTPGNVKVLPGKVEMVSEGVWQITQKATLQW